VSARERPPLRLLFDQNLSHWLTSRVRDLYAGAMHVRDAGLSSATDDAVWQYANEGTPPRFGGRRRTTLIVQKRRVATYAATCS
jgi:hypothetical protein